jgi:hypothetical protein
MIDIIAPPCSDLIPFILIAIITYPTNDIQTPAAGHETVEPAVLGAELLSCGRLCAPAANH